MYKLKSKLENHDKFQILAEEYVEWSINDIENIEKKSLGQSTNFKIGNYKW